MTDTAYYYPAPYWAMRDNSWIKSLLLFFDEVAILLPNYMYGRHMAADPTLAGPLEDLDLLKVLEPSDWVDAETTNKLAEIIVDLLTNGTFDELPKADYFLELSQSRIGYGADVDLSDFLVKELQTRDLARPSEDGVSIPLHPTVRTTILVILAQLFRVSGAKRGMFVHPTTNHPEAIKDLVETFSREQMPSRGNVIKLDLEPVSCNLDSVPLEDVLQFRTEHLDSHRAYMRDLRGFIAELAEIDYPHERETKLRERRQEIADAARELQRCTRQTLRKDLTSWSLGIAGSVWSITTGDPIGLALTAAGIIPKLVPSSPKMVSAYSYLFHANNTFGR